MQTNPEYPTCLDTYATFRAISHVHGCEEISRRLGLLPTDCRPITSGRSRYQGAINWRLCSKGCAPPRQPHAHMDWLLARLAPAALEIRSLVQEGTKADIVSFFVSAGEGGPELLPEQLELLARIGVTVWWDVYFGTPKEYED